MKNSRSEAYDYILKNYVEIYMIDAVQERRLVIDLFWQNISTKYDNFDWNYGTFMFCFASAIILSVIQLKT